MELDCSAQRLLVAALKNQIEAWRTLSNSGQLSEEERADLENDIGYAFTVLSEIESDFFKQFGYHPE